MSVVNGAIASCPPTPTPARVNIAPLEHASPPSHLSNSQKLAVLSSILTGTSTYILDTNTLQYQSLTLNNTSPPPVRPPPTATIILLQSQQDIHILNNDLNLKVDADYLIVTERQATPSTPTPSLTTTAPHASTSSPSSSPQPATTTTAPPQDPSPPSPQLPLSPSPQTVPPPTASPPQPSAPPTPTPPITPLLSRSLPLTSIDGILPPALPLGVPTSIVYQGTTYTVTLHPTNKISHPAPPPIATAPALMSINSTNIDTLQSNTAGRPRKEIIEAYAYANPNTILLFQEVQTVKKVTAAEKAALLQAPPPPTTTTNNTHTIFEIPLFKKGRTPVFTGSRGQRTYVPNTLSPTLLPTLSCSKNNLLTVNLIYDNAPCIIVNVHIQADRVGTSARSANISRTSEIVKQAAQDYPTACIIVVGDFNMKKLDVATTFINDFTATILNHQTTLHNEAGVPTFFKRVMGTSGISHQITVIDHLITLIPHSSPTPLPTVSIINTNTVYPPIDTQHSTITARFGTATTPAPAQQTATRTGIYHPVDDTDPVKALYAQHQTTINKTQSIKYTRDQNNDSYHLSHHASWTRLNSSTPTPQTAEDIDQLNSQVLENIFKAQHEILDRSAEIDRARHGPQCTKNGTTPKQTDLNANLNSIRQLIIKTEHFGQPFGLHRVPQNMIKPILFAAHDVLSKQLLSRHLLHKRRAIQATIEDSANMMAWHNYHEGERKIRNALLPESDSSQDQPSLLVYTNPHDPNATTQTATEPQDMANIFSQQLADNEQASIDAQIQTKDIALQRLSVFSQHANWPSWDSASLATTLQHLSRHEKSLSNLRLQSLANQPRETQLSKRLRAATLAANATAIVTDEIAPLIPVISTTIETIVNQGLQLSKLVMIHHENTDPDVDTATPVKNNINYALAAISTLRTVAPTVRHKPLHTCILKLMTPHEKQLKSIHNANHPQSAALPPITTFTASTLLKIVKTVSKIVSTSYSSTLMDSTHPSWVLFDIIIKMDHCIGLAKLPRTRDCRRMIRTPIRHLASSIDIKDELKRLIEQVFDGKVHPDDMLPPETQTAMASIFTIQELERALLQLQAFKATGADFLKVDTLKTALRSTNKKKRLAKYYTRQQLALNRHNKQLKEGTNGISIAPHKNPASKRYTASAASLSDTTPSESTSPETTSPMLLSLQTLVNAVWQTGHIPSTWTYNKICRLYKGTKFDPTNPKSYRPISIISSMSKFMNKLIVNRMQDTGMTKHYMHPNQAAYQPHKNRDELTQAVAQFISINNQSHISLLFLDLSSAFDTVEHGKLKKLLGSKFSDQDHPLLKYTTTMMDNLSYTTRLKPHESTKRQQRVGVRQGDPLSPILFNFYFDLILRVTNTAMKAICGETIDFILNVYADDLCLGCTCPLKLNKALQIITFTAEMLGLRINHDKSFILPIPPAKPRGRPAPTTTFIPDSANPTQTVEQDLATIDTHTWSFHDHNNTVKTFPITKTFRYLGLDIHTHDTIAKLANFNPYTTMQDTILKAIEDQSLPQWLKISAISRYIHPRLTHNATAIGLSTLQSEANAKSFRKKANQFLKRQVAKAITNSAPIGRINPDKVSSPASLLSANNIGLPSAHVITQTISNACMRLTTPELVVNEYLDNSTTIAPPKGSIIHHAFEKILNTLQRVVVDPSKPHQLINILPMIPAPFRVALDGTMLNENPRQRRPPRNLIPSPLTVPTPTPTAAAQLPPPITPIATTPTNPTPTLPLPTQITLVMRQEHFFPIYFTNPPRPLNTKSPNWKAIVANGVMNSEIIVSDTKADHLFFQPNKVTVARELQKIARTHSSGIFSDESWNILIAMNGEYYTHYRYQARTTIKFVFQCRCGQPLTQRHTFTCPELSTYHDIARRKLHDYMRDSKITPILIEAQHTYTTALSKKETITASLKIKYDTTPCHQMIDHPTSTTSLQNLNRYCYGFDPARYTDMNTVWKQHHKASQYLLFHTNKIGPNSDKRLELATDPDFISLFHIEEYLQSNQGIPLIPTKLNQNDRAALTALTNSLHATTMGWKHLVTPPISTHGYLYTYYHLLLGSAYLSLVWRDPDLPTAPVREDQLPPPHSPPPSTTPSSPLSSGHHPQAPTSPTVIASPPPNMPTTLA